MGTALAVDDPTAEANLRVPHLDAVAPCHPVRENRGAHGGANDAENLQEGAVFWGRSPAIAALRARVAVLARSPLPVLIEGETGTGKSFLAEHVLHPRSGAKGPLVVTDLSTIPDSLMPSHLFGARRGSYTGSVDDHPGVFEQAHGGTLFLDEIANLDPETQRRLLLVLERGTVTRLGDCRPRPAAPRIVAATNLEVAQLVREGRFRHDLHARLNPATRVRVPSLRERKEDLPELIRFAFADALRSGSLLPLVRAWLARFPESEGAGDVWFAHSPAAAHRRAELAVVVPERALERLVTHHWPGNHRELKLFATNALVSLLVKRLDGGGDEDGRYVLTVSEGVVDQLLDDPAARPSSIPKDAPSGGPPARRIEVGLKPGRTFAEISADVERQYLTALFHAHGGDLGRMAVELFGPGASRRKVHLRMNQLGLRLRSLRGTLSSRPP
jgi:DNA-binding NtrC family response regulator